MSAPGGVSEFGGGDLAYNMEQGGKRYPADDVRAIYQTNVDDPASVPDVARVVKDRGEE